MASLYNLPPQHVTSSAAADWTSWRLWTFIKGLLFRVEYQNEAELKPHASLLSLPPGLCLETEHPRPPLSSPVSVYLSVFVSSIHQAVCIFTHVSIDHYTTAWTHVLCHCLGVGWTSDQRGSYQRLLHGSAECCGSMVLWWSTNTQAVWLGSLCVPLGPVWRSADVLSHF